jgi:hypothetical protein
MPALPAHDYGHAMAITTGFAATPLREMLEHQRLALREQRLAAVIHALRARTHAYESPPRALKQAIADFAAEQDALRRRLDELERAARPPSAARTRRPGGS